MNPELHGQLSDAVQLIIHTILPALSVLVLAALVARAMLSQESAPSTAAFPASAASPATLEHVFGAENVRIARSLVVEAVQELLGEVDKFGGHPTGVTRAEWPRCGACGEPLTFVCQLRAGEKQRVTYPREGLLQVFVCSARSLEGRGGECDTADPRRGASHVRFVPMGADDVTLGEDAWERDVLASAVRRNTGEPRGGTLRLSGVEKVGRDGRLYYPYLARQYAVVSVELQPSVRLPRDPTGQQVLLWTAACTALRVQVGGFPAWLRGEPRDGCSCGAGWEVVLEMDPFDEVLRIPVAARITVQACAARHGAGAFRLFWQAP